MTHGPASEALTLLAEIVRQSRFVHLTYCDEAEEWYIVTVSHDSTRRAISRNTLEHAIEVISGHEPLRRCSRCKDQKAVSQFPPTYERKHGKSDGGAKHWCLACQREYSRMAMRARRAKLKGSAPS